ncbi:MAG: pro-sigmaK processing inhibitor BofA family protein [Clostridia bacterium]|nr:pro-sigmaK processing inhibitor BofA family protein [Clostridia bacterium]
MAETIQVLFAIAFLVFIIVLIGRLFVRPMKLILKVLYSSVLGLILLWMVNIVGAYWGFFIPVNWLTILLVGFLGLPGLVLIFLLRLIL